MAETIGPTLPTPLAVGEKVQVRFHRLGSARSAEMTGTVLVYDSGIVRVQWEKGWVSVFSIHNVDSVTILK